MCGAAAVYVSVESVLEICILRDSSEFQIKVQMNHLHLIRNLCLPAGLSRTHRTPTQYVAISFSANVNHMAWPGAAFVARPKRNEIDGFFFESDTRRTQVGGDVP